MCGKSLGPQCYFDTTSMSMNTSLKKAISMDSNNNELDCSILFKRCNQNKSKLFLWNTKILCKYRKKSMFLTNHNDSLK